VGCFDSPRPWLGLAFLYDVSLGHAALTIRRGCLSRLSPVLALLAGPSGEDLRTQLIRGGMGSVALKASHVLLNLAVTVLLARVLGPEDFGVYAYLYALVLLVGTPAQLGIPMLVLREVAAYHVKEEWGLLKGLLARASQAVLVTTGFTILTALAGALVYGEALPENTLRTLPWALVLLPLLALNSLRGSTLSGFRRVVQGLLPEQLVLPGVFLLLAAGTVVAPTAQLSAPRAMVLHVLAAGSAFGVGALLLIRATPTQVRHAEPRYDTRRWMASVVPLSLIAGMQMINSRTDVVMLGLFGSTEDVGVYRVVAMAASQIGLTLAAANAVIAPQISRLYAAGEQQRLQRLVTTSARVVLISALPLAVALMAFGEPLLGVVFGTEYTVGQPALAILSVGQLVNVGMGSVGVLLNMTGHERDTAVGLGIAAAANVLLNLALIPPFGVEGAATATMATYCIWNGILARQVYRRLGIIPVGFVAR